MMSDTWFKSSKEATCSNNTRICEDFWGVAWGAWRGENGKGLNCRAIGPKIIMKMSRFEVEKSEIFDLKCFVSISRIVLPVWAGTTFSKKS